MEPVTDPVEKEKAWEDLGRPDPDFQYAFTIVVHEDGAVSTEVIGGDKVRRRATTFDIYQACREIVGDIESLLLADRVTKSVLTALSMNQSDETRERLRSALSERGIDTSKA
jgi:hypothetical protein